MNDNGVTDDELNLIITGILHINELTLAKALLAEREEREKIQDVWCDAPKEATLMKVDYVGANFYLQKDYTRTLPKTRAREITEKAAIEAGICDNPMAKKYAADIIEAAIREYAEGEKNV